MAAKTKKDVTYYAHYISGTHWDREWYRPVQEFRLLLVQLVDLLLDLMENTPEFRYFHLDGQTCIIEDYLSLRPENTERLHRLMRDGRILIGPWFTMPDLFGPGDEALIRNLLMGQKIAGQWDVPAMSVAYTCDMFGHPSQMPQLYAGFDLYDCVLGRGTNEHTTPSFFQWQGPDGSSVFTYKLQDSDGYGTFVKTRNALENSSDPQAQKHAGEIMRGYLDYEIKRSNVPVLCLIDANDHMLPAVDAPRYLELIKQAHANMEASHSTLPAFFEQARQCCDAEAVPVRCGELREPARQNEGGYLFLIPNCPSSRVRMKQANDNCQIMLEKWAEPLAAWANLEGANLAAGFLQEAWKELLLCHAHDSICGCSIDQVHRDMMYRYDQSRVLAMQVRHQAVGALTAGCADLAQNEDEFTLTLVNPVAQSRREVVAFDVDLPTEYAMKFCDGFTGQVVKAFTLETADGQVVPYQRLTYLPNHLERTRVAIPAQHNQGRFDRYTVAAEIDLPACGFTSLRVKPSSKPVRVMGSLRTAANAAENEYLHIEIASNGTLALTDKRTGQVYSDLLGLEDKAETGDGWFHGSSINEQAVLSTSSSAQCAVVHDGPYQVTFDVTVTLELPRRYDFERQMRGEETVVMKVTNRITLRQGACTVEVETRFDNVAEDHQLRLLLPTDVAADTYLAHHPFDFVERAIALDEETCDWREAEITEKPFLSMQAIGKAGRGLACISASGVHEGGVVDDERRTMMVTLMRSYRATVSTAGEVDGLELGKHAYRFKLMPFAGELPRAEALRELATLQAGIITRQTGERPSGYPAMTGDGEPRRSFVELLDGQLAMAALKSSEDGTGLIMRLWNPTGKALTETVRCYRKIKQARYVKLSEKPIDDAEAVTIDGNTMTIAAGGHKIVTVAFILE